MKTKFILFLTVISFFSITNSFSNYNSSIDLELFLMRKGSNVKVVLMSDGTDVPSELVVERKSTAPLSKYRKVLTISTNQLSELMAEKKLLLTDLYPESRQLDSYYRVSYITKEGIIKKMPAIFLAKASGDHSITFGDHKKDETMFELEEEKNILNYETYGISFTIESEPTQVLITVAGGSSLNGSWFIERKSSKPLSSFRRIKSISKEDEALIKGEKHVFTDKYPESRKLDAYYRLMVVQEDGEILEFPSLLLARTSNGRK